MRDIITLCDNLSQNQNRSHWTISRRIFGKSDFFDRLKKGGGCTYVNYHKALNWFSDNWPDDLPWPSDITRPQPHQPSQPHPKGE